MDIGNEIIHISVDEFLFVSAVLLKLKCPQLIATKELQDITAHYIASLADALLNSCIGEEADE
jgi:hypothetical protein